MKPFYLYIGGTIGALVISAVLAWIIFSGSPGGSTQTPGASFGAAQNVGSGAPAASGGSLSGDTSPAGVVTAQKIFKISDGPVAGAALVQTYFPTTTLARFVMADTGRAYELSLDAAGAVQKTLSNTTIPAVLSAQWGQGGAVLQYLDGSTPKTLYLSVPGPNSTSTAVRLSYLPDGITSLALSPDGKQVAYLLRTAAGSDGYSAAINGTGGKKLFSLPLRDVQLRWPAQGTLLAYSDAATGVPGIAFSIDAKTGAATPLLVATGLTATADAAFKHVLYQTADGAARTSYDHDVVSGAQTALSFDPMPEQCVQSPLNVSVLLCAVPLSYVPPNYLDGWHQGTASAADSLVVYDLSTGRSGVLATPGGQDGGVATDMAQLAVSPDGGYAIFISKYDRSLWAVRLGR